MKVALVLVFSFLSTSLVSAQQCDTASPPMLSSSPPGNIQVRLSPTNADTIELQWEPLPCSVLHSSFVRYHIEYGREDGIGDIRTAMTMMLNISGSTADDSDGLETLDKGVVYFFRVAVRTLVGLGQYSDNVMILTPDIVETTAPPTTVPPTTTPPPTTTIPPTTPTTAPPTTPPPTTPPPTTPPPTTPPPTTPPPTTPQPTTPPPTTPPTTPPPTTPPTTPPPTTPTTPTTMPTTPTTPTTLPTTPTDNVAIPSTMTPPTSSGSTSSSELTSTTSIALTGEGTPATLPLLPSESGGGNSAVVVVPILLVLILMLLTGTLVLGYFVWKRKSTFKNHRYNVRAMDDSFLEMNRDSAILATSTPLSNSFTDEIKAVEPTLASYKNIVYTDEGEEITLQVDFNGNPYPTITWFFDGIRLSEDREEGREVTEEGFLHISKVQRNHAGTYDFIVSNVSGSVEGCTKLIVYLKDRKVERRTGPVKTCSNPIKQEEFGEHVAKYHQNSDSGFSEEFDSLSSGETGQKVTIGRTSINRHYNRFRGITCYDNNRVALEPLHRFPECREDYVNASYIDGYARAKKFIATQTPLSHTITDFWRMIWQEKVQTIVMLNSSAEGKLKKSEIYWPEAGTREHGPFMLTTVEYQVFADYTIRTLQLVASKDIRLSLSSRNVRKVTHFHFTSWPDHGVPDYAGPLLMFQRRVKSQHKPTKGPVLIHCDGGVGRTGVFIATEIALEQAARESVVDIAAIVYKMRNQRMKMVQHQDQYTFIHNAVLESLTCGNTQIPAAAMKKALVRLSNKAINTQRNGFETQFHVLEQVSPKPSDIPRNTASTYSDKNRSLDFLPPDKWRVVLKSQNLKETYIHASYANGYKQRSGFIIAQAPMKNTTEEFWKMVHDKDVAVIVMLSEFYEDEKEVCYQYWPSSGNAGIDGETHGEHTVYTLETKRQDRFIVRKLGVTGSKTANMKRVTHFMMDNWNSDGTCSEPTAVMKMIDQLLIAQRRTGNKPIVIHGIDTVSRCAVFCSLLSCIEHCKTESVVDVFQMVKALRIQKPGSVQTVEQYHFIYELVLLFLNTFTLYSNFK